MTVWEELCAVCKDKGLTIALTQKEGKWNVKVKRELSEKFSIPTGNVNELDKELSKIKEEIEKNSKFA